MSNATPPKPFDEEFRQRVLDSLAILDTDPTPQFDRVAGLARQHFGARFALVSLVDSDRQWFLARCGLDATETPREDAFCAHAVAADRILVVLDATRDARFDGNPLVVGPPHIRFYGGAPIRIHGAPIGTLCVIDDKMRQAFGPEEQESLQAFARIVEDEFSLREFTRKNADSLITILCDAERLSQAGEEAKAQFLNLMSHELRTPLNAVIGFAECISGEVLGAIDAVTYKEFAKNITVAGKRQLALIDRLLELTDQGSVDLHEETFDFGALLRSSLETLSGEVMVAQVDVDARLPEVAIRLHGDAVHIEQIALELIGNAVKFTPRGGRVRVGIAVDAEDCIVLTVTDEGVGIAPDALDNAFAAFGQVSIGLNRRYGGAGIGLPIVKKLAEMHGAELTLATPAEGGTRTTVRFPRYRTIADRAEARLRG